ncbi:hypothetical protein [Streptomyces sp. UNOC14_S4]|uniref:hypothetical protein n=1 Tax=Streptomyces sp. UNOC14_S4 TaxID=2872340 RepID=UPI001E30CBCC|nr:hypothetical protein [Streptomyces sp. UNOC14_S4]MCC3766007.1 hypothetical protein [Streptomyces sp. UNOC14_S4]
MRQYIKDNPILTRTVIVGLLTALVHVVPALAGVEANEVVIGGLNTLLVLIIGLESRTRVTANHKIASLPAPAPQSFIPADNSVQL